MAKSLLVISRQAPWSGPSAREALDIVLAGGAFDLPVGLLFLDDGVFQLALQQDDSGLVRHERVAVGHAHTALSASDRRHPIAVHLSRDDGVTRRIAQHRIHTPVVFGDIFRRIAGGRAKVQRLPRRGADAAVPPKDSVRHTAVRAQGTELILYD